MTTRRLLQSSIDLIVLTLRAKWHRYMVHFYGRSLDHFRGLCSFRGRHRPASGPQRTRAARWTHGCPARGRAHGASGARHPAAVDAFARRRSRRRQEHRGRRLLRIDRRGLADRPAGLRYPGGKAGRAAPGRRSRTNDADNASSDVRNDAGLAEPGGVSPGAVADRGPTGPDRGAARRLRLRRRPRQARAAHRPRGLSGASPRGVRRAGADHHLLRFPCMCSC